MKSIITNFIKYEKLSKEIKDEIAKFQESVKEYNADIEDAMYEWFSTKFDEWMEMRGIDKKGSKRKHYRLEVEIPIKIFETLIESTDDEHSKTYVGQVVNISKGGLYFIYEKSIKISSIIKVKIDLSEIEKELHDVEALAMITRSEKLDDGKYGIGIVFSSIYGDYKKNLEIYILKNLANYIYSR